MKYSAQFSERISKGMYFARTGRERDICIFPKLILDLYSMAWNFAQRTAVSRPRPVQNVKLASCEISDTFSLSYQKSALWITSANLYVTYICLLKYRSRTYHFTSGCCDCLWWDYIAWSDHVTFDHFLTFCIICPTFSLRWYLKIILALAIRRPCQTNVIFSP